ncbi:hypothetical protein QR680_011895 [Steinernema hermaphroditum]|uniref:Uncharacterized protein n=1 Tax=Steinernema hermaphroditum TaxID=289476 RepID=A0AA39LYV2_9BILA|nr:hypothetical protein QR680_011895 [Steinernema hermaphroditum]
MILSRGITKAFASTAALRQSDQIPSCLVDVLLFRSIRVTLLSRAPFVGTVLMFEMIPPPPVVEVAPSPPPPPSPSDSVEDAARVLLAL